MSVDERDAEAQIRRDRLAKVATLRDRGTDPYPARFAGRVPVAEVRQRFEGLAAGEESGERVRVAGRIAGRRGHGKAMFLDLVDASGTIQLHATLDGLGPRYAELGELDLGDVVGV